MISPRHSLLFVLMVAGGYAALADKAATLGDGPKGQPNVVIFFSDDAGYADFSMHGSRTCPTPNIDSIAQRGIRFTDGYATASSCGPSRAGLITGRYQQRFGYYTNVSNTKIEEGGLPLTETTIAELLRAVGYRTIALGKWHLGATEEFHPLHRGFDDFYGFLGGQRNYWPGDEKIPVYRLRKNFQPVSEDFEYFTDELARQATAYIGQQQGKPFFMYLAFNAVHTPMHARQDDMQSIRDPQNDKRRKLAAMTVALDRAVGRVMSKLRELGLEKNTLVFFANDNGGAYINESNNWPLRGTKGSCFEGGNRVPFTVQWPAVLPKGKLYTHPVSTLDILPTVLSAAGEDASGKTKQLLDGVNLLPYLAGKRNDPPHEALYWKVNNRCWAIRQGDWKLVRFYDLGTMLFRLADDGGETRNLAGKHPEIVQRLDKKFRAWESQLAPPAWKPEAIDGQLDETRQAIMSRFAHPGGDEERLTSTLP